MRIKSRWSKKGKTHTIEEIAGAVAFINWRIAGNCLLSLENNDFQTDTHEQRLKIISEFLIFTIHMIDRMTIENFDENERVRFITELVTKTAKHLEDNKRDLIGPGDYRDEFVQLLNERINEYSEFSYDEKDFAEAEPEIKREIKRELVSSLWSIEEGMKAYRSEDPVVQKALGLMEQAKQMIS